MVEYRVSARRNLFSTLWGTFHKETDTEAVIQAIYRINAWEKDGYSFSHARVFRLAGSERQEIAYLEPADWDSKDWNEDTVGIDYPGG